MYHSADDMAVTAFMLLLALASLSLAEDHHYYVSAANGKDCPADSDCHNLSYYLSDPELYFTSNTKITFLEGKHLLNREEPIKISQVIDLLLLGIGKWVRGPEETIMESTAVIYCTKGSGGFAFYDSSRITITNLSLINCGALHSDKVLIENSTFLFSTISELNLHYISIQNSSGHGIIAYNCVFTKLYSCSIAYSNIEKGSLDILQCNRQLMNGSNVLILHNMPCHLSHRFYALHSNFTNGCGKSGYGNGSLVVHAANNDHNILIILKEIRIVQKIQNSGNGVVIWSNKSQVEFHFSESTVIGRGLGEPMRHAKGLSIETLTSTVSINIDTVAFINNSGGQVFFQLYHGVVDGLYMMNTLFSHQHVLIPTQYTGVYIDTRDTNMFRLVFINLTMSLENAFAIGFSLVITSTHHLSIEEGAIILNSRFNANRNMKSVVKLAVNRQVNITNCIFFDNNGGSVISVSTDQLLFNNVTFANNSMTAVAVWNGVVQFSGSNEIQNNHGTGIFLQGSSHIKVNGNSELTFLNNTARTVGGAIHVNDMREFQNDYCSILVSNNSQIIFSGNWAVEGGGDVYGARLVDCLDIDSNRVLRQGQPNETSWYFNIPQSHTMQFNNTDTLSSLSSDPIMVCFCNEIGFPNCSKRSLSHESMFPGQEVVTEITTVGNYGGTSSGTVSIAVHNATLIRPYGPQGTTAQCLKLHLLLESVNPTSASVAITVNGGLPEWGVTLVVDIIECPPGFHKNEQSGRCECAPILKNYNISCIIAHNASYFRRSGSNWFAFLNSSNRTCLTVYTDCPFDYCNSSQVTFSILNPDHQCTGGREGILWVRQVLLLLLRKANQLQGILMLRKYEAL